MLKKGHMKEFSKKHKINLSTEIIAGITTFLTMAYILIINPKILSDAGMPYEAVFTVTALGAGIGCLLMGVMANRPLAVATGMGLNAYFAYTAVLGMGFVWEEVMAAAFVSSALIFLIAFFRINIAKAIPESFKHALIAGLGLFLVFIGMQNAHFVVTDPATVVGIGNLLDPRALIAVLGFFITALLVARNTRGALFIGIVITAIVSIIIGIAPIPDGIFSLPPSPESIVFKLDFGALLKTSLLPVIWTLFIISFFDLVGTNIAMLTKAKYAKKKGEISGLRETLEANGLAGSIGALIGAPTIITFLESATGIKAGGRTGIVSIVVGILFFASLFFFPLINAIPIEAAAPAIIMVGLLMLASIKGMDFSDESESIPALLTLGTIPFTFSISNGIAVGSISYVFLKIVTGKANEIHPAMYLIAMLSILEFANIF
ncbi:MAG: NCS2 family permease [Candidatus ainarchaeum sp.]|nr:NCS2 family permease [Candidatus ainarchaeum sp.]